MVAFFTVIHVLLCVFMIFVILLQPGKDAGMGAALGGGAATSAFGGRGAVTFLSKLTAVCAGLFFLTSLGLSFVGLRASVADRVVVPVEAPKPADAKPAETPGTTPAPPAGMEQPSGSAPTTSAPSGTSTPAAPAPTESAPAPAPAPQK